MVSLVSLLKHRRSLSVLTFSNEILSPYKATDLNPGFGKVFNERSEKNIKPKKLYAIVYCVYPRTANVTKHVTQKTIKN